MFFSSVIHHFFLTLFESASEYDTPNIERPIHYIVRHDGDTLFAVE